MHLSEPFVEEVSDTTGVRHQFARVVHGGRLCERPLRLR
jgi:hypothetical protein